MKYLLDTDTCIYALKQQPAVIGVLLSKRRVDVGLSVLTEAELRTGAAKSKSPRRTLTRLEAFLAPLQILEFASADARVYARVRRRLEVAGRPIGPLDTLIAAHALSRSLTLVTNNVRELRRVKGLSLENWRREHTRSSR